MSKGYKSENLLIDFDNTVVEELKSKENASSNASTTIGIDSLPMQSNKYELSATPKALMSSQTPIYKLLGLGTPDDAGSNNPFDQMDKQAALLDDPFEILENAASHSQDNQMRNAVETGTLISLESPANLKIESDAKFSFENPSTDITNKKENINESVQNISPISSIENMKSTPRCASPSNKSRCRVKNSSLNLLKYSLSNSRVDGFNENESPLLSDDNSSADEKSQKNTPKLATRRESLTDDSFDDIWATKPNLVDSQTDFDVDSDIDSDIAKLNIPMLNEVMDGMKLDDKTNSKSRDPSPPTEGSLIEAKHNRSELLEKFASIKQKIPQSPMPSANVTHPIVHNETVEIKPIQMFDSDDEPITPKSQYSSVLPQHQHQTDNRDSLIENLKRLVDQCDDKRRQSTAKNLLDNLCTILTSNDETNSSTETFTPQLIKRQGTFSIENDEKEESCSANASAESSAESVIPGAQAETMDPGLSEIVKQVQNMFGNNQNMNVQQITQAATESSAMPSVNPTYIVVMTQPSMDVNNGLTLDDSSMSNQRFHRGRSSSLNLKERPLSALRAAQNKIEQKPPQIQTTPTRRPSLSRRSSFSSTSRPTINKPNENDIKVPDEKKTDTLFKFKRRSLQHQPQPESIKPAPQTNVNITRRRSFQEPSTKIRSPSPKTSIQARTTTSSNRLSLNSGVNLNRRKSFNNEIPSRDSPQKNKTSYSIMKKPAALPATRNLKIRVTQTMNTRSTAPLRAVVPMSRVAPLLCTGAVASPDEQPKAEKLITSTPRLSLSSSSLKLKKGK